MVSVCFYFHVHQPRRLREYTVFDIGNKSDYFDDAKNAEILRKVANKCYLPTNNIILGLINKHAGKFKVAYSITGTILEQLEKYAPEVIESFKALARTGSVEFIGETYYHSLSYIYSKDEFKEQVKAHKEKIKELFNQEPTVFRNTELVFNNELSKFIQDMGYKAILAEGADHILQGRSPNFLYNTVSAKNIKVLLKNYKLSDDIAFRFSNKEWNEYPLTSEKHADWINKINGNGEVVNLFMDYETFGEHQWDDTGIFKFLWNLPEKILANPDNNFMTPGEVADTYPVRGTIDVHNFISWADMERDLTAWLGNSMQHAAANELFKIENRVKASGNKELLEAWRHLTTSDHFYYMCTKWFSDGDVHKYFSPYESPYDAYIIFMNILNDFARKLDTLNASSKHPQSKIITADKVLLTETPSNINYN